VEFATAADGNDVTEIQFNDKPPNGMSGFSWCYDLCIYFSVFCSLYHVFSA